MPPGRAGPADTLTGFPGHCAAGCSWGHAFSSQRVSEVNVSGCECVRLSLCVCMCRRAQLRKLPGVFTQFLCRRDNLRPPAGSPYRLELMTPELPPFCPEPLTVPSADGGPRYVSRPPGHSSCCRKNRPGYQNVPDCRPRCWPEIVIQPCIVKWAGTRVLP